MVIADISGYTRFMVANQTALAHSQEIIGALLASILDEVQIPLTVGKLEGDAVFLYAVKGNDDVLARIRENLMRFFTSSQARCASSRRDAPVPAKRAGTSINSA